MRLTAITILLFGAATCMAQDVRINGGGTGDDLDETPVLKSVNVSSAHKDRPAIWAQSTPYYNYGVGVESHASFCAVKAIAEGAAGSVRYGTQTSASGGSWNYGLYTYAPTAYGSYAAYISGNMLMAGTITYLSDARLKKDINPMGPTLDKIMNLKPKTYSMIQTSAGIEAGSLAQDAQEGLIAQDVQTVFPDLVSDVSVIDPTKNKTGGNATPTLYKGVNYMGLVPVLVKALQEQQAQIQDLQDQVKALKKKLP